MDSLENAIQSLNKALPNALSGPQLQGIKSTIDQYAVSAAVAGAVSGFVPGVAGILAALTQTGLVWATYVKINQALGISMQENTAKFLGSAIATNMITNVGAMLVSYAAAAVISFIPLIGQFLAATADAAIGYVFIYACATIYLKLITKLVRPDGTIEIVDEEATKNIIKDIINRSDMKEIISEGRNNYKKAKNEGVIDEAIKNHEQKSKNAIEIERKI